MPSTSRYDEAADFYVAEVGEGIDDEGTAALLTLVGDVRDMRVLDIACGHGRVSRELARRGARVTGVDVSAELIERARRIDSARPLEITYVIGDASSVKDLDSEPFDRAVCNFGLSDIDDLAGAFDSVAHALQPGSSFVFSILHPCFPGWGPHVSSSWLPGRGYFHEGWWRTDAHASRIRSTVGANHRTVSTYLNEMTRCGLQVDRLLEPLPPRAWLTADPTTDPVPTFLVVRSIKGAARPSP